MKKLLALLVVGSLLALTTGCPPGSTTGPAATTTGGGGTTDTTVKGKAKADGTKDKVTVTDKDGKDADVTLTSDTKFTGDAKAGDEIKKDWNITATVKDGKATSIDVKKPS